jgi:hypothetical protein
MRCTERHPPTQDQSLFPPRKHQHHAIHRLFPFRLRPDSVICPHCSMKLCSSSWCHAKPLHSHAWGMKAWPKIDLAHSGTGLRASSDAGAVQSCTASFYNTIEKHILNGSRIASCHFIAYMMSTWSSLMRTSRHGVACQRRPTNLSSADRVLPPLDAHRSTTSSVKHSQSNTVSLRKSSS